MNKMSLIVFKFEAFIIMSSLYSIMTKKNTKTVNWSAFNVLEIKLELEDHPLFMSTYEHL